MASSRRQSKFERHIRLMVGEGHVDFGTFIKSLSSLAWAPAIPLLIKLYGVLNGKEGMPEYRDLCLETMGSIGGRRARAFLIEQLGLHKSDPLGDWAIIGLCRCASIQKCDLEMLILLLEDPEATISTKESAVKGLSNQAERIGWGKRYALEPGQVEKLGEIARWALNHEHPEMRVSGIWLASKLHICEDRIKELAQTDHAQACGCTVSEEAKCHIPDD